MEIVQNCVFVFLSITDEEKTNFCYCRDPIRIVRKNPLISVFSFSLVKYYVMTVRFEICCVDTTATGSSNGVALLL